MNTFEQLAAKAADVELSEVNWLTRKGEIARKTRAADRVEFKFIDGETLTVPRSETEKPGFDDLKFKLRPSKNDS